MPSESTYHNLSLTDQGCSIGPASESINSAGISHFPRRVGHVHRIDQNKGRRGGRGGGCRLGAET